MSIIPSRAPNKRAAANPYLGSVKTTLMGAFALVAVPIHDTSGATSPDIVAVVSGTLRMIALPDDKLIARA